ncbi:MAG: hypothetical protein SFV51_25745 [Bryobacteraceae bacterium]|nr:hypothetical protein [Bryobacteraceae bacterium]
MVEFHAAAPGSRFREKLAPSCTLLVEVIRNGDGQSKADPS